MKNISENHTKHGPKIVKNRAPRLQKSRKIIKNEFWNSKGEFWNSTWRRIVPEVVPKVKNPIRMSPKGPFWRSFWETFSIKIDFFRHRFSHQISEGILRGF